MYQHKNELFNTEPLVNGLVRKFPLNIYLYEIDKSSINTELWDDDSYHQIEDNWEIIKNILNPKIKDTISKISLKNTCITKYNIKERKIMTNSYIPENCS